jgi:hypothetical protein
MIAFTTIVLGGPLYERISYTLADTFLKHTQDCQLVILTDNPVAYENYWDQKRIHIVNIGEQLADRYATLKYKCLEQTWKLLEPEFIVYVDADVYFTQDLDNDCFEDLPEGLSVPLGIESYKAEQFANETVGKKAISLQTMVEIIYRPFVERCMVFKVGKQYRQLFSRFLLNWQHYTVLIVSRNLTSAAEMIEIQNACLLASFPLNDLKNHVLSQVLWTLERNGDTYSALR